MKNQLLILFLALLTITACKETDKAEASETTEEKTEEKAKLDNETFDKRVAALRSFVKAHCDEDIDAQAALIADTLKWSPAAYNGNAWLGKTEFLEAIKGYHDNFDNITYTEGVIVPDGTNPGGFFAGSAYSKDGGSTDPNAIRCYGTWNATHTESGKTIGAKWYGIAGFNEDNKVAMWTEFWDVNGLAAQLAAEE